MKLENLLLWLVLATGAVLLLAVVGRLSQRKPLVTKKRFLTETEARVLAMLEAALPEHRIMAQVAMGALLQAGSKDRKKAHSARNMFAQKIVDFVVVTRATAEVVALIELDDRTHQAAKDRKRDAMTASAGYRTIRLAAGRRPTAESVRAAVAELGVPAASLTTDQHRQHR
jgi:hypothetical protein